MCHGLFLLGSAFTQFLHSLSAAREFLCQWNGLRHTDSKTEGGSVYIPIIILHCNNGVIV